MPVARVNVADALAYCDWRSNVEHAVVRLPTAEEWEKAARGTDGRLFPWGNEENFWFCNCLEFVGLENRGYSQRQPWDRFLRNSSPYGVHDMAGNVCEWTGSEFHKADPPHDEPGVGNELRGGSFIFPLKDCKCFAARPRFDSDGAEYIGFRCVTEI